MDNQTNKLSCRLKISSFSLLFTIALILLLTSVISAKLGAASPDEALQKAQIIPGDYQAIFLMGNNSYIADGQKKEMDGTSFIKDNRALVPVRYLALALGVTMEQILWSPSSETVTLIKDDNKIVMTVGDNIIHVNGQVQDMETVPVIQEGRVYIPARYVAEAFGYEVGWNQERQAVLIKSSATEDEPMTQIHIDETSQGQTLNLQTGQTIRLLLPSNPSTGYSWIYTQPLNDRVLKEISRDFQADSSAIGAGGTECWTFEAIGEGSVSLGLWYCRPWESVQPLKTFNVDLEILAR